MKRAILYLMLPLLLFYSCKKEHSVQPAKTYKVSFAINNFVQSNSPYSTSAHQSVNSLGKKNDATGLAASSNFLYYRVYNASTGAIVDKINQDSSMASFGHIDDYLPAGTFYVVFVGSKNAVSINNNGYANAETYITSPQQWPDISFQKDTVTVTGGDVNQNITMHRIVGQLTVKLTDALPANASKISIGINEEFSRFLFSTAEGDSNTTINSVSYSGTIPPSAIGVANWFSHSMFIMTDVRPITVTITCYDSNGNTLVQAIVPNVTMQHDTQTILTGQLFGVNTGLNLGLNQPWSSTSISIQF